MASVDVMTFPIPVAFSMVSITPRIPVSGAVIRRSLYKVRKFCVQVIVVGTVQFICGKCRREFDRDCASAMKEPGCASHLLC